MDTETDTQAGTRLIDAVLARLDTRCVTWQFGVGYAQRRCGACDGCLADRWAQQATG